MKKFGRKTLSLILALTLILSALPMSFCLTASAATAEEYAAIGTYTDITESYHLRGGVVYDDSGNFGTTYVSGSGNMVIYKIPLPTIPEDQQIGQFVLRFGRGGTVPFKVMRIDSDQWNFSSLPMSVPTTDPRLAPLVDSATNGDYAVNDAEIVNVATTVSPYHVAYADITAYAREHHEKGDKFFYVAAGAWNSTTNCALASMTDSTYKAVNLQPAFSYNTIGKHSVEAYESVGTFTGITESYQMRGGVVSEDSGNFGTSHITKGSNVVANMVIMKFPLPAYHESIDLNRFIIRFGRGGSSAFKILKLDVDEWDLSSLPLTVETTDPRLAPLISATTVDNFAANDAPIITVASPNSSYKYSYADVSAYARECYEAGQEYFYLGVGAWNSTTNVAVASMTDTSYRGAKLYPGFYCSVTSPYSEALPQYPEVTKEQLETLIEGTVDGGHPYLFGRQADFDRIKKYAFGEDEAMTEMYQVFKDKAAVYVDKAVSQITTDITENSYLSRATSALDIMMSCSFVYMVEGDTDYADRAIAEAMYFAENMETWGRAQSLDVNHTALGIAICYDWLYNYMTDEQRTAIGDAMFSKHLDEIYDFFTNPTKEEYKWSFHQMYLASNNHAVLDNCSVFVEALAVCDRNPEISATIMAEALKHLTRRNGPFDKLYPDSGWYEGSSYWSYVGPFMAKMFSSMESAFGSCLGFENNEYITGNAYFPIYTQSSNRRLIYSDAGTARTESSTFYYFGHMSGDGALMKYVIDNKYFSEPLLCLWYNPEEKPSGELSLQKDKLFRNIDVGTMRSTWDNDQEIFVGMAVQDPKETHAFMAMGTLALDALGETWITNPGKEYYSIGNYWNNTQDGVRWTYYSTRAEANSCVVINPSEDGGQLVNSPAMIDNMSYGADRAYMTTDLSSAYADAEKYNRGVMLYNDRSRVVIQDEITLNAASDVYSFVNVYKSDIEISDDGSYAILSKGNKHIYVKVISDKPYELTTYEACSTALGTSPNPDGQTDFTADYERLCVKYDDVTGDINLSVILVPYLSDNIPEVDEVQIPISDWTLADAGNEKPVLEALSINGKELPDFDGSVNYYKYYTPYFEANIDAVAEGCTVEVKNNYKTNCFDIHVTDNTNGAENHYCVDVVLTGEVTADTQIGGSQASDSYFLSENYGQNETIFMRLSGKYSIMSYYKLKLPYIPVGKTVKNASLILNQYRNTNSANKDAYEFHLVDTDSWTEDEICYYNAPVRHTYGTEWYPYKKTSVIGEYNKGNYTEESIPDIKTGYLDIKTVPTRLGHNDRFYAEHSYDLTALVDKSNFENLRDYDNEFSFGMGHVILGTYGSSANTTIATKEHSNEALRPKVYVELENAPSTIDFAAEKGKVIANPKGDELYFTSENSAVSKGDKISALTYFINLDSENEKSAIVYLAQYTEDGELISLTPHQVTVGAGEAETVLTPQTDAADVATRFEVFVWVDGQTPVELK
ncbi:MAG: hypothetical protein E7395_08230 [Ruminococcaceae bacterium]|nr:hypothetical protein [Oscillospiraceae bacterium]